MNKRKRWISVVAAALLWAPVVAGSADNPIEDAMAAFQRGDFASAEATLQAALQHHPQDVDALTVLGVVLDNEKKYADADRVYRRAIALSPRSPSLLNNYGNHLVASGHPAEARAAFLRVLAIDPEHLNAAVQLARLALENKAPQEALHYLGRFAAKTTLPPDAAILLMQAEYLAGRQPEADSALAGLASAARADPRLNCKLGVALASAQQYANAEKFLTRALDGDPRNFEILYNLGLAASHAGHNERAQEVLAIALEQQPQNVDALYDLAAVKGALNHKDDALSLLVKAAQIAPDRADVQLLLARTAADLGYFGDSVQAWDRYIKLKPADDSARRERAVAESIAGQDDNSLADLHWYLSRHPNDAVAHYDLGIVKSATDGGEALAQFNRAIALKSDFAAAYLARASLQYRQGHAAAALPDLELAARYDPKNPIVFDRMGQSYLALDRKADALRAFRKAADLAPRNSTILLHLAQSLSKSGQAGEARTVMARLRDLGPERSTVLPRPAGLLDFLGLSPDEQYAQYRAGVERTVASNPSNAEAQVEYLKLSLRERQLDRVTAICGRLVELNPATPLLSQAGQALLDAEQYATAKSFLQAALARSGPAAVLNLDLAIATFYAGDKQGALKQMDRVPASERNGEFFLARARMLVETGRAAEADAAVRQAVALAVRQPELYRGAAVLLIANHEVAQALGILTQAVQKLPNDPRLLLCQAVALELNSQSDAAQRVLSDVESRWPEWYKVWLAHGIILTSHHQPEQARELLDTARALGAPASEINDSLDQLLQRLAMGHVP